MFEIRRTKTSIRLSRFRYSAEAGRSVRIRIADMVPGATELPVGAEAWSAAERLQVLADVVAQNIASARAMTKIIVVANESLLELAGARLVQPTGGEVEVALAALRPLLRALEGRGKP